MAHKTEGPYDIGETVELLVNVKRRIDNVAVNPATVSFIIQPPTGNATTVIAANTGTTGEFRATYEPTVAGRHTYKVVGDDTYKVREPGYFFVRG